MSDKLVQCIEHDRYFSKYSKITEKKHDLLLLSNSGILEFQVLSKIIIILDTFIHAPSKPKDFDYDLQC